MSVNSLFNHSQTNIIRQLAYSSVFSYPLTLKQLIEKRSASESVYDVEESVNYLVNNKFIYTDGKHFSLFNNNDWGKNRVQGEMLVPERLQDAFKYSKIIASFPFVRGICLSGTISKNCMQSDSDIDYFVITAANKLWICRTILVLYRFLFLGNSRHNFCLNYFISENDLLIPDHNIFTATEISTLIPVYNYDVYISFLDANKWYLNYLPHSPVHGNKYIVTDSKIAFTEKLFYGWGIVVEKMLFNLTLWRWKMKYKKLDKTLFNLNFRSQKNVSKSHSNSFQIKVLEKYEHIMNTFLQQASSISTHENTFSK